MVIVGVRTRTNSKVEYTYNAYGQTRSVTKDDVSNNVTRAVSVADGDKVATNYTYDAANRPTKTTLNSDVNFTYSYDSLGRLGGYTLNLAGTAEVPVTYTYYTSNRGSNFHTTQIKTENIGGRVYSYTYDKNGNILTISIDGTLKHSYVYDGLGQLKRENNVDTNETIKYTYDNGGNIDKKEYYTYTK